MICLGCQRGPGECICAELGRDAEVDWDHGHARCPACGHHWIAVYPSGTDPLECPRCGDLAGTIL